MERPISVIQLLLSFVQIGMLLSVLPLQLLLPFLFRLVKPHIHISRSLFPLMIPLPIISKGMTTSMRFSSIQNLSFGMKPLCSIDMALKPQITHSGISLCLPQNNIEGLINAIYPGIDQGNILDQFFLECTIRSSKNDTVDQLDEMILDWYVSPDISSVHQPNYNFLDFLERSLSIRV